MPETRSKTPTCRIVNVSKQLVSLQVVQPGGDFFIHEQQVRLGPGQHALLPKTHLNRSQVDNLKKSGIIKITFDSDPDS